jgi:hypothetical protein
VACSSGDGGPRAISDAADVPDPGTGSGGAGGTGETGGSAAGGKAGSDPVTSGMGSEFYKVGDKLDPATGWHGYLEGSTEESVITLGDFYDPSGSKGIAALLITEGSTDCPACVTEAMDLPGHVAGSWKTNGVKVLQLMVSDATGMAATTGTAAQWSKKVHATWPVAADPDFTFATAGENPYPIQVVIDPRTLTIVARITGYHSTYDSLDSLAEKNK